VSGWSVEKAQVIASEIRADVLAVQETHLAKYPLECAHTTSRNMELHLHHGPPVTERVNGIYGRSCGVGFVTRRGVPLAAVDPVGAAWRKLEAVGRWHGVRLAPRLGLPLGLLLLSVYAPLQVRAQQGAREAFVSLVQEVTHGLDMQVPTLLLGDFNGSADPPRDFLSVSGSRRPVCPLLSHLLGPGSAWVDVHRALLEVVPWTIQLIDTTGRVSASRIDLVLANHEAMRLVRAASVMEEVRDGGHSPVLVELQVSGVVAISWCRPRPRPPPLFNRSSQELSQSAEWRALVEGWLASPAAQRLVDPAVPHNATSLSTALVAALQHLVSLAGGWQQRPPVRRRAYDSDTLRAARRSLANLHRLFSHLHSALQGPPGPWPRGVLSTGAPFGGRWGTPPF
jgi:exonuclease III